MISRFALVLIVLAPACSSASSSGSPAPPGGAGACDVADVVLADKSCQPPGVPPSMCAAGFVADGHGGCDATLPPAPCGRGTMAVPGDTTCHAVGAPDAPSCPPGKLAVPGDASCRDLADCGAAPWGAIPVDATTKYVDASYAPSDSDGSQAKPFKTIGAAVQAATSGAIVAIASGSYRENIAPGTKSVRLWGRCPALVEIVATGGANGAALTFAGAATAGSEAHQLSITGDGAGVYVPSSTNIVLDAVRVHDTTHEGVSGDGGIIIARGSLFENNTITAFAWGNGSATIERSVVRDTLPTSDGHFGRGVQIDSGAKLALRESVVERVHEDGVFVLASDAVIESTIIRDIATRASDGRFGRGVTVRTDGVRRGTLTLRASTVERSRAVAVFASGSDATLDRALVRDTASDEKRLEGDGIDAQADATSREPSKVVVTGSLFEKNRYYGIALLGSDLDFQGSVVRDTMSAEADGTHGAGIVGSYDDITQRRASLHVRGSLLERNAASEVSVEGSDAVVEASVLRDTLPIRSGEFGRGVSTSVAPKSRQRAAITVRACLLKNNHDVGIAGDSADVIVQATTITDMQPEAATGEFGRAIHLQSGALGLVAPASITDTRVSAAFEGGIVVQDMDATLERTFVSGTVASSHGLGDGVIVDGGGTVTMRGVRVEGSARAGVSAFGSSVSLDGVSLVCNAIPIDGESAADHPFAVDTSRPSRCACGATSTSKCQVLSSNLEAPKPLAPPQ